MIDKPKWVVCDLKAGVEDLHTSRSKGAAALFEVQGNRIFSSCICNNNISFC